MRGLPIKRLDLTWQRESDQPVTDQGIVFLEGLPLTHLELKGNLNMTDAGLAALQCFSMVKLSLDGHECPFTDQGLLYFCNMSSLRNLTLKGGNRQITEQGRAALKAVLPEVSMHVCNSDNWRPSIYPYF